MQKTGNFSLTGFCDEQTQNHFKQSLIKLGCNHIEKLSQTTNILVVNATFTEKFKIAQLNKNPISCVTKKWVEDSIKKKTLQAPDKYLISEKQMFLGTNVAICGFAPDKLQKIQKIIKQRQGITITSYRALDIIRKYSELSQKIDVILASNDEIERAKHAKHPALNDDILPLVRIQWLEDSLKRKRCKFPNDYAVNLLQTKPITVNTGKLLKKLNIFMQNDIMDKSGDFLEDTLIYIDKDLNMDFTKILKKLISVCGGYWTDRFTPIVTHVLLSEVDESKYQQFKKYGSRIYILRPQWLMDSILLYNRLQEEDYLIRCFKVNENIMRNLMQQERARNNQNSQNFNSLPGFGDQRFPASSNTIPVMQTEKKSNRTQLKTNIFRGRNFYLTPEIINDPLYSDLIKTIRTAGGQTYDKINSRMYVYVVLKDSPKNIEIHDKLVASKYKCITVSERWVKECVKKNSFIEPDTKVYFHFNAFKFTTPLGDFHKFVFEIVGYDNLITLRIRELVQVLGSTRVNPNKSEVTHILCGPSLQNNQSKEKINKILQQNKKVKLINSSWLFQCINEGKSVSFSNYLIEDPDRDMLLTPEKKSEQSSTSSEKRTIKLESLSP